jgi:hypothetical protein
MGVDVERIRFVTRHYRDLQGLKLLPLAAWGAALLAVYTLHGFDGPLRSWWIALFVLAFATAIAGMMAIGRWYRRRFGWVASARPRKWTMFEHVGGGIMMLGVFLLTIGEVSPVSLTGLFFGAGIGVRSWPWRRFAPHWVAVGAAIAGLSLVPLGAALPAVPGVPEDTHPFNGVTVWLVLWLVAFVVGAVLDHRVLVRQLETRGAADNDDVS